MTQCATILDAAMLSFYVPLGAVIVILGLCWLCHWLAN